jgi:hypothetical protein
MNRAELTEKKLTAEGAENAERKTPEKTSALSAYSAVNLFFFQETH